jgi:hypothetical protein
MINTFLIYFRFSFIFFFLSPLVVRLFINKKDEILFIFLSSIGLSLGIGSYFLFLLYLWNGKAVSQSSSFIGLYFIFCVTFVLYRKENISFCKYLIKKTYKVIREINFKSLLDYFFEGPIGMVRLLIVILLVYAFLLGPFFPISQWDDLVRYAAWGSNIFGRGEIGPDINSFPLLVSLLYTYGFLSSGFRNDYIIKFIPLIFGFLTLALTYVIANDFFEKRKFRGLLSVFFVLCFIPFFDWLHLGYVDIASSFYFVGSFYYFYRFAKTKLNSNLFLWGIFLGLSLWTKQQTLGVYISALISVTVLFINGRKQFLDSKITISLHSLLLAFLVSLPIFLPWYIRDWLIIGTPLQIPFFGTAVEVMPNILTPFLNNVDSLGFYSVAFFQIAVFFIILYLFKPSTEGFNISRRTFRIISFLFMLSVAIPMLFRGGRYLPGVLTLYSRAAFLIGIFLLVNSFRLFKNIIFQLRTIPFLILLWLIPFYFVWWLKYPTVFRYLLTIIPLFSLLLVYVFDEIWPIFRKYIKLSPITNIFTLFLLTGFVFLRLTDALTLKGLTYFFADEKTKGAMIVDESYIVGNFLNNYSQGKGRSKIISTDNRLAYYAPLVDIYNNTPAYLSDLTHFDYYILNPWTQQAYDTRKSGEYEVYLNLLNENPNVFEKIFEQGPYKIYKILVKDSDFILPNKSSPPVLMGQQKIELTIEKNSPNSLTDSKTYFLAKWKDKLKSLRNQVMLTGSQGTVTAANNKIFDAYFLCLKLNNCGAAEEPLNEFRNILVSLNSQAISPRRLLIDSNFVLMQEVASNVDLWFSILSDISANNSSASVLAQEIKDQNLSTLIDSYQLIVARREPLFSYYNKDGTMIEKNTNNDK